MLFKIDRFTREDMVNVVDACNKAKTKPGVWVEAYRHHWLLWGMHIWYVNQAESIIRTYGKVFNLNLKIRRREMPDIKYTAVDVKCE